MNLIKQNFAKPIHWKLHDIPNIIIGNNKKYFLRGVIVFHGSERCGLRSATGHYTAYTKKSNELWELYDDTKVKVIPSSSNNKKEIELLFYTL